jgi:glucokinase
MPEHGKIGLRAVITRLGENCVKRTLALDIGGTNFSVAVFEDRSLIQVETRPTLRDAGPVGMLDQIEQVIEGWTLSGQLDGCGIGFGGPVHFADQRVIYSTHVAGWDDFDLPGEVLRRFGTRSIMDRDTLVGALGEGFHGAGKGIRPIFYITLSTGIGGGFLDEHGLLRGADSFGCELGHHTIVPDGPPCLCGSSGCLERMCSGLWLERDYGKPAKELMQEAQFVEKYVVFLARGLKNCIMFFNPARIIIGGGIAAAGDALFFPLRRELARQMPPWSKARVDVVPAAQGRHTILWGALELTFHELY